MLLLILAVLLGSSPVRAEPCALPAESELSSLNPPPEPSWTLQERWVWQRTLADEIADFNELYCEQFDSKTAVDAWQTPDKPRRLSERFLLDVLIKPPFVEAVSRLGLRVIGAWFPTPLNLSSIEFKRTIWLNGSRFDGPVSAVQSKTESVISFQGSTFEAALNMETLETGGLSLNDGTFRGDVTLFSAKVGDDLEATRATFEAALNMEALETGDVLFLNDGTFKKDVRLFSAKVGNDLEADRVTFEAALNMESLGVSDALFLRDGTFKGDVTLFRAKVGGALEADRATFEAALNMESLGVGGALLLNDGTFKGDVKLIEAKVGQGCSLRGATFHSVLNVSGAAIDGELELGSSEKFPVRWEPTARFLLRNASVGSFQDQLLKLPEGTQYDGWPKRNLELDGFTYKRLGGIAGEGESAMINRPASWYEEWLRRDISFSPQPYRQLVNVFREAGADATANDILYALRNRELGEAWQQGEYGQWLGLSLLKVTIGYGIGGGYFWALLWALAFTALGTWILYKGSAEARKRGWPWCAWASFDEILPVIELDEEHPKFINAEMKGLRLWYFYSHRIAAYLLGSFIIAGLAGLTQGK